MSMNEFDRAMSLTPVQMRPGVSVGTLGDAWSIGHAVNGGALMALSAQALRNELGGEGGHEDPLVMSTFFLSAALPGELTATTETIRRGRSSATGQVSLAQPGPDGSGAERVRAIGTYGDLNASAKVHRGTAIPDLPHPDLCLSALDFPGTHLATAPVTRRVDLRFSPESAGWALGTPSLRGEMRAWIRLADGRDADPVALLFLLDAMPPVAFDLGILGWAPTMELTAHVRAKPEPGWLRMLVKTENLTHGLLEEDAYLWDSAGRLVAQSRQLAGVRLPDLAFAQQRGE